MGSTRKEVIAAYFTNQAIIVKTLETKSLLPSLCKREEFPSLKKGLGEIFIGLCLFYYGLLNKSVYIEFPKSKQ
jgi:hypothetical protein